MSEATRESLKQARERIDARTQRSQEENRTSARRLQLVMKAQNELVQRWPIALHGAIGELSQNLIDYNFEIVVLPPEDWIGNVAYLPRHQQSKVRWNSSHLGAASPAVSVRLRSTEPNDRTRFTPLTFAFTQNQEEPSIRAFVAAPDDIAGAAPLGDPIEISEMPDRRILITILEMYVQNVTKEPAANARSA